MIRTHNHRTHRPAPRRLCRTFAPALLLAALAGCPEDQFTESGKAGLIRFKSGDEVKQYLADQVDAVQRWRGGGAPGIFFLGGGVAQPLAAAEGDASASYSTTNIQEDGVDEGDVVKTDGEYLFILDDTALKIVRARPVNDLAVVAQVALTGVPIQMYLRGNQLAVLTGNGPVPLSDVGGPEIALYAPGTDAETSLTILDVTDRTAPQVVSTLTVEGTLMTSRLIDAALHLVLQTWPNLPEQSSRSAVLAQSVDELLPDWELARADGTSVASNVVAPGDLYHPIDPDGWSVTAIVTFNLDDPAAPPHSTGVVAGAGTVYASPAALYLSDLDYNYAGGWRQATDLYKFDLAADGAAFVAAGSINGRLLNRFSLGEHNGYLRAATTDEQFNAADFSASQSSAVYVLAPDGDQLNVVGSVDGIAPGEQIYAARFVGDRGFLVTFQRIDPLFTLDLADPAAPKVVGELKVPGYSDYIHPLDDDHLLTIGKDAIDVGGFAWFQGVQLSLFDVTDFAAPTQLSAKIVGDRGTESEALYEPHAFTWFAPSELLAVPMMIAEGAGNDPADYGVPTFNGLCLYSVSTTTGIEPFAQIPLSAPPNVYFPFGVPQWTRGVFINDFVYAVTPREVAALPLADPSAAPERVSLD